MSSKIIAILLIVSVFSVTLLNDPYFGSPSLAAYFLYTILTPLLIVFAGFVYFKSKVSVTNYNYLPLIFCFGLTCYCFLQSLIQENKGINNTQLYLAVNFLLLLAFFLILKIQLICRNIVYKIISVLATIEALICLLQSFDLIKCQSEYFFVSGTWVNPNVTAMFLALSVPAVLVGLIRGHSFLKVIYAVSMFVILIAQLLLKCRSAFFGSVIAAIVILFNHYNLIEFLKYRLNLVRKLIVLLVVVSILIPSFIYLYKIKQTSTEGRQLIWKISAQMVADKPIVGFGYGSFEREYNQRQAQYFASGQATTAEIDNASFVHMAYNEYLQNMVEGGFIGAILFTGFLISLLLPSKIGATESNKTYKIGLENAAAKGGVASFAFISIINFSFQAIPVMALLSFYAAVICCNPIDAHSRNVIPFAMPVLISILVISGIVIFCRQLSLASAYAKVKSVERKLEETDFDDEVNLIQSCENKMKLSDFYWNVYGRVLCKQKKYAIALNKFKQASKYSSSPSIQMEIADCFFRVKIYDSAINTLQFASNMVPNILGPKYALMKIYQKIHDTINAMNMASQLIAMKPKGISQKAFYYKQEAQIFLNLNKN